MSSKFMGFITVACDDAYPLYRARNPIYDSRGRECAAKVLHNKRRILLNPRVRPWKLNEVLARVERFARRTYEATDKTA